MVAYEVIAEQTKKKNKKDQWRHDGNDEEVLVINATELKQNDTRIFIKKKIDRVFWKIWAPIDYNFQLFCWQLKKQFDTM